MNKNVTVGHADKSITLCRREPLLDAARGLALLGTGKQSLGGGAAR
jgi:hypothetical protein